MTVDEWKAEAVKLRRLPSERGVAWVYWKTYLDRARGELAQPRGSLRYHPSASLIRRMSPRERAEMHEGRELAEGTQLLRMGRSSWYVIEPETHSPGSHIRVS